jgi:hypothetical protein
MSELSHEVEMVLHGKMNGESIRVIAELVDFMKYKEDQAKWAAIDAGEAEKITDDEAEEIQRIRTEGAFTPIETVMERLNGEDSTRV